jgi:hypothetical protein
MDFAALLGKLSPNASRQSNDGERPKRKQSLAWRATKGVASVPWKAFKASQANTLPGVLMGWNKGVQPKNVARAYFGPQRMLYDGAKIGASGSSLGQMLFPGALNRSVSNSGAAGMFAEGSQPIRSGLGWAAGMMGFGAAGPNRGMNPGAQPDGPPQPRRSWSEYGASWIPGRAAKDGARSALAAGGSAMKAAGALARFKPGEAKKHMADFVRHLTEANKALEAHSRFRQEENRELARFNANIAYSNAVLEIGRLRRKIELANETSASARYANEARNRFEQSQQPWNEFKAWAGNYFAGFADNIRAAINEAANAIVDAIVPDIFGGEEKPGPRNPNLTLFDDAIREAQRRRGEKPRPPKMD